MEKLVVAIVKAAVVKGNRERALAMFVQATCVPCVFGVLVLFLGFGEVKSQRIPSFAVCISEASKFGYLA